MKDNLTFEEARDQECEHGLSKLIVCPKCHPEEYEDFAKSDQFKRIMKELEELYPQYFNRPYSSEIERCLPKA